MALLALGYQIDTCEPQMRAVRQGKIKLHALTKGHYPGVKLSSDVMPGLNSIGFWDGIGAQDWGLDEHRNEGVEISLLETGKWGFTVDKRLYEVAPGSLTITRPWQLHKLGDPNIGPGRLHWLIFDVRVRRPNQEWHWPDWLMLTPHDLADPQTASQRNAGVEINARNRANVSKACTAHPGLEPAALCFAHDRQA
jgi:AraC family L-rhamnose operon regulatory protein RhaS